MVKKLLSMKLIIFTLIGLILIFGVFFIFTFFIYANKTVSPNEEYTASYNRFSKVITVEETNTHIESHYGNCESPAFFWSPNSKFLAMTITDAADGNRFSQILDLEHNYMCLVPTKSYVQRYIQNLNKKTQMIDKNKKNAMMEITKWLDNKNVLVEFSWPSDKPKKAIAGRFIFEVSTYSIKQFTIAG